MPKEKFNLLEKIYEYQDFVWSNIIEPKLRGCPDDYKMTLSGKILYYLLYWYLYYLQLIVWFLTKRLICHLKGCKISYCSINDNLYKGAECLRCKIYEDYTIGNYGKLIEK